MAILLGCMSAAILVAEATIFPSGVYLSLFSILINDVRKQEVLVQVIFKIRILGNMLPKTAQKEKWDFILIVWDDHGP